MPAVTIALASTCAETWSSEAASRSTSSASIRPPAVTTSVTPGSPLGQRAGLVEQHHLPGGQAFQRAAALDDDADARGPGQPGHDRDRGGEQQRARRRDDQHRDGADRVTAERPGRGREDERERHEEDGEPVGGAHERRRRGLRLLDQAHHPGVGGLGGRRGRDQLDRLPGVDHAAADVVAGDPLDRQRLPGERGLVQHRRAEQPAVDRDDLSGAHEQAVTERTTSSTGTSTTPPSTRRRAVRGARSTSRLSSRRARAAARASSSCPLASITVIIGAGERLVDRQSAGQREHRDHVDARLAASDRADRPADREDQAQHGTGDPQHARGRRGGQQPRHTARE